MSSDQVDPTVWNSLSDVTVSQNVPFLACYNFDISLTSTDFDILAEMLVKMLNFRNVSKESKNTLLSHLAQQCFYLHYLTKQENTKMHIFT